MSHLLWHRIIPTLGALTALVYCSSLPAQSQIVYELVISNGRVVDPASDGICV